MPRVGTVSDTLPPSGRVVGGHDWDALAKKAKRIAPKSLLAAENVRYSLIKSVKQYTRAPFRTAQGYIQVNMRNSYVEDGVRYGNVWFTWMPYENEGDK